MAASDAFIFFFRIVTLIASGLLCARLVSFGLHRKYRVFFAYLIFLVLRTVAGFPFRSQSDIYFKLWAFTEPVYWLFYVLLVLEVYTLVLQQYRGIQSLSRWALGCGLGASLGLSALSLIPMLNDPLHPSHVLFYYLRVERALELSLVIFLLLVMMFLAWYPVPLSRNILVYCGVYSIYFISESTGLLIRSITGFQVTETLNVFLTAVSAACMVTWLVLLNVRGEKETHVMAVPHGEDEERRLIAQLSSLNATLMRAANSTVRN